MPEMNFKFASGYQNLPFPPDNCLLQGSMLFTLHLNIRIKDFPICFLPSLMKFDLSKSLFLALICTLNFGFEINAQVEGISIVSAENYYLDKDYRNALIGFEDYLLTIQFDKKISYKAGICATKLGIGKRAIQHILATKKEGEIDNYVPFWLGRAYHLDEQWDSAAKYLNVYLDVFPIDKTFKREAERYLAQIEKAKSMIPTSLQPMVVENMGNGINSFYSEFHPLLTRDGKMMVYAGRRKGYSEEKLLDDGEYKEKIFSSRKLEDGTWSKGIPIRLVEGRNKDLDYNIVQFIDNDSKLLLYKMVENSAKLYVSEYSNESWKLPYPIPIEPDPRFFTGDIVFTDDLKTVVFTNNGNTNAFQSDLYTSHYNEKTEKWSEPVFLSKNINTPQDEAAPFFIDPKTLVFSSKSNDGLGDFDLYKSIWDENLKAWAKPVNMGFPYNTPNNDFYFFLQADKPDVHYFSSIRGTTKGQTDIYKVFKTAVVSAKGNIRDETGAPIASALVYFDDPENYQNIKVTTDASGNFTSDLVAGQTYLVRFKNKYKQNLEHPLAILFPANQQQLNNINIQLLPKEAAKKEIESETAPGE